MTQIHHRRVELVHLSPPPFLHARSAVASSSPSRCLELAQTQHQSSRRLGGEAMTALELQARRSYSSRDSGAGDGRAAADLGRWRRGCGGAADDESWRQGCSGSSKEETTELAVVGADSSLPLLHPPPLAAALDSCLAPAAPYSRRRPHLLSRSRLPLSAAPTIPSAMDASPAVATSSCRCPAIPSAADVSPATVASSHRHSCLLFATVDFSHRRHCHPLPSSWLPSAQVASPVSSPRFPSARRFGGNGGVAAEQEAAAHGSGGGGGCGRARLSLLEVLDNIFSRLHIYDVVRTSALLRAWRRRWRSLPTVDLSRSHGISASDVDALLLRRSAPVRAFRLALPDISWSETTFHDWLIHLSRRGVRDLCLQFPHPPGTIELHSSVFSCRELTRLSLVNCCIRPAPPGSAGLPNLKTLRLIRVSIQGATIHDHGGRALETLIAASPLLEEVTLLKVRLLGDHLDSAWTIRSPNLRRLTIASGFDYGGRTENLQRLEEAVLFGPNYAKFLNGMAGVTKLEFYCAFILPTEVDVLDRLPFLFGNLRSLVIEVIFCKISHMSSIVCLLRSAPILEELDVWAWSDGTQEIEANNEFLNAQCVDHMFTKLHIVLSSVVVNFVSAGVIACIRVAGEQESSTFTNNSDERMQTHEACPRRRHRLNFESVAQVEQLREELLKLKSVREDNLRRLGCKNEMLATRAKESCEFREYFSSAIQITSELGDAPVNTVVGVESSRADSPEDKVTRYAANACANSPHTP
ncbi:hypothetical protein PR202_gb02973 [Eleusine coracana subsp. coracana]|uniref:F-box/LRR-repeat protein 15/At3g58940/PEG3-like LRR domain-containing protein n=1 Tax=Eleusine coracana subsp. coracana TaxID=191504 RepID=A0AAV5DZV3_ELECO|nr:hypothetical protein PR202_gb02973 [Eleusine coracana subsp. coracana]